jgi:PAS domain S-box-containing protein
MTPPLSDADRLLAAIIDGSYDAVIAIDMKGRITFWNEAATRLYGYSADEMLGQQRKKLLAPDQAGAEERLMRDVIAGDPASHMDTVRLARDSRRVDVSVRYSPIRDSGGAIIGVSEMARDLTGHREAERRWAREAEDRLKESNAELKDLKAALDQHAIVAITDPQGRITFVNEKFCAISKYSREELIGKDHRIINSGMHPAEFFRELWTTIARGEVWHGEIRNRAKDGSYYWVDTTIVPFLNAAGKPRQYVAIRAEITERKLAEEALKQRTEELTRSNRDLEQFAYVASHDLQEPLRAVAGCVQILQRRYQGQLDARADELIAHAVDGSNRMRKLIEDLLAFSRAGTHGGQLQPVDAGAALDGALRNLSVAIQESGTIVSRDPLPTVRADATQLTLVFQNLLANAMKFRREDPPKIHVSARQERAGWVLSVSDNGIGIDPQYFTRLFGVFQRLHTRREYPGTGIGLAICKRIIERHGGRIWVESTPGQGTIFFFHLAAAAPAAQLSGETTRAPAPHADRVA